MSLNILIYIFLVWNSLKLFLINADPIIQLLNLLISSGIYFVKMVSDNFHQTQKISLIK